MGRVLRHVALPALAPAAIVALYFMPLSLIGCANRGWAALTVVFVSATAAFVALACAFRTGRGSPEGRWWILSALILTLPLVLLIWPLG